MRVDLQTTFGPGVTATGGLLSGVRLLILTDDLPLLTGYGLTAINAAQTEGAEVHFALGADRTALGPGDWNENPRSPRVHLLPRSASGGRSIARLRYFAELIEAVQPTLIHGFGQDALICGGMAARLHNVPFVYALPKLVPRSSSGSFVGQALEQLLRRCGMALATGHSRALAIARDPAEKAELMERRRAAILVRGATIDLTHIKPREIRSGVPTIMLPAALASAAADAQIFAGVSALTKARGVRADFVMLGSASSENGPAVPIHPALVARWKPDAFECIPLRGADILCLPGTITDGLAPLLIEALARGIPIVAGDCPEIRPIVHHGSNGILVPPGDAGALAQALEKLVKDQKFRKAASLAARAVAEAEFSQDCVATAAIAVYRVALAGLGPTRQHGSVIERARAS